MLCYIISDWEPRDSTLNLTLTIPHINESYLTTARTAAFIPCASPPEVNTAIVFPIPNCWLIELIEVSAIPKVFMVFMISPAIKTTIANTYIGTESDLEFRIIDWNYL